MTSAILCLSCLSFVAAGNPPLVDPASDPRDPYPSATLIMDSHVATYYDIMDLRSRFGVRPAGETYEPALVDGHGTGLVPRTEDEWGQLVGRLTIFEADSVPEALPSAFDLSADDEFPVVGNQASQGSCSAWAATYYSYGYLEAVDNAWTEASLGAPGQLMSPAWTYNMVNGGKDRGSWVDTNMMVIVDWGTATMATMPYDQYDFTRWGSPEAFREAPSHRASEVGYLEYSPATTVEAIKALVTAGTPVAFAMDASQYTSGFSDGNYIISSTEYSSTSLNHAQTIVGYDDSLSDDSDNGAFRVVNSWGTNWGDSGYYWFTYDALEELGSIDQLYLNFIVDIPAYEPSLLGVWHFDQAPSRSSSISLGVGDSPGEDDTKEPYFEGGLDTTREVFPTFMCLDMTELATTFWSEGGMHLYVGDSRYDGTISSFRVEGYVSEFQPGRASQLSGQSADVPKGTPGSVSAYLEYYDPIPVEEALDSTALEWSSSGQATWVGVDHHSSGDGDSLQTGDVSDNAYTRLEAQVEGPAEVWFDWKVSSQSGKDSLELLMDDALLESVSGDTDWTEVSVVVGEGVHTLAWVYTKDGSVSALGDSGWLDSLTVTGVVIDPPVISLLDSYAAEAGAEFAIAPEVLEHHPYSEVTVWYDWGDSGPWSMSTSVDGYSATHVYALSGTHTLTAYAADDSGHNVSDSASVRVIEPNQLPTIVINEVSPSEDYFSPGVTVTFTVQVTDLEGGSITVGSSYGDGTPVETASQSGVLPGAIVEFEFDHLYAEGSDTAFEATFTASDGDEHVLPDWNCAVRLVLVNSHPAAAISADTVAAATGQSITFDASESSDPETDHASLQYRWDWTGDGVWDTDWSSASEVSHWYDLPGEYEVSVEVKDGIGLVSSASISVAVTGEAIPEFSTLAVPVVLVLLALLIARYGARRKDT